MVDLEKIKCPAGEELYWYGCYEREIRFKKYLHPDTFAHPAKMSLPLADRIFKHLNKLGLIKEGDMVIDFMAGSSRTGVIASLHGCKFVGVELEPHFIELSEKNHQQVEKRLGREMDWEIIQGDSRNLSEILKEGGAGVVSPPYQDSRTVGKGQTRNLWGEQKKGRYGDLSGYNPSNPSNIGNLKDKPLVGITSPPYGDIEKRDRSKEKHWDEHREIEKSGGTVKISKGYQASDKNIGHLSDKPLVGVVSPPFVTSIAGDAGKKEDYWKQIGGIGHKSDYDKKLPKEKRGFLRSKEERKKYYQTTNIGNLGWSRLKPQEEIPESYLSAMIQVYSEAFRCGISPLVIVTKNPTHEGALRRLDLDTAFLLEQVGYKIIDYHRAILFTEHEQHTLTNSTIKKSKGRLSFFKRLSWAKGSPVAQWEDILFAMMPKSGDDRK